MNNFDITVIVNVESKIAFLDRCLRSITSQSLFGRNCEIILYGNNDLRSYEEKFSKFMFVRMIDSSVGLKEVIMSSFGRFVSIIHASDYLSDHMFFTQLLFLHDNFSYDAISPTHVCVNLSEEKISKLTAKQFGLSSYGILVRRESLLKVFQNENSSSVTSLNSLLDWVDRNLNTYLLQISFYRKLIDNI